MSQVKKEIQILQGVEVNIDNEISIKGPKGELKRKLFHPLLSITKENDKIVFKTKKEDKKTKMITNTFASHIKNMIKGVTEGFVYELKICSGHFPMSVSTEGENLIIKNFLGEKTQRKARIIPSVNLEIKGDIIKIESTDKEKAGQTAGNIEQAMIIKGRDRRKFQDGIYLINKAGKEIR